jgi:hypothetical protein
MSFLLHIVPYHCWESCITSQCVITQIGRREDGLGLVDFFSFLRGMWSPDFLLAVSTRVRLLWSTLLWEVLLVISLLSATFKGALLWTTVMKLPVFPEGNGILLWWMFRLASLNRRFFFLWEQVVGACWAGRLGQATSFHTLISETEVAKFPLSKNAVVKNFLACGSLQKSVLSVSSYKGNIPLSWSEGKGVGENICRAIHCSFLLIIWSRSNTVSGVLWGLPWSFGLNSQKTWNHMWGSLMNRC